jgi:hypothetical protein
VKTEVTRYGLAQANAALADLREGRLQGVSIDHPQPVGAIQTGSC